MDATWTRRKKLLAEAGFPNGFETVLSAPSDRSWTVTECQAAAEQWKDIGVRVKLNVVPGDRVPGTTGPRCRLAHHWSHRPLGLMILDLAYRTGVPWNETSYSNPEFDRLLTKRTARSISPSGAKSWAKLEQIMHEDGPVAQPLWRKLFTFWNKSVLGYTMHPSQYFFGSRLALQQA